VGSTIRDDRQAADARQGVGGPGADDRGRAPRPVRRTLRRAGRVRQPVLARPPGRVATPGPRRDDQFGW